MYKILHVKCNTSICISKQQRISKIDTCVIAVLLNDMTYGTLSRHKCIIFFTLQTIQVHSLEM